MTYLAQGKKEDLQYIASEMGIENTTRLNVFELKRAITEFENYDEDFVKEWLNNVVKERKRREELEEMKRKDQLEELKRKEELEELKRKDQLEQQKRREEMEFELQKKRLENEGRRNENNTEVNTFKPKLDLHSILQKFDPKSNDISLYLVLFERQVKRAEIKKELYVSYLIGLLPYDITQIIAREDEDVTNDYDKVKELLLKRYKLTPERFRQLFTKHYKRNEITWSDYAYELKNYFQEWIRGLGIQTFDQLSDLIITDQIKRKVPPEIREHFIDQWSQFKTPEDLITKLDDYENVRINMFKRQKDSVRKEATDFNWKNERYDDNRERKNSKDGKYIPPQFREENSKRTNKDEGFNVRKSVKECYICGLPHFARECPKRYNKQHNNDKKQKDDVLTAEIRSELLKNTEPKIVINPLQYVDILIYGQELKTLIDSGTQIPILNARYLPSQIETKGKIVLSSAFGERIEAELANIEITLKNEDSEKFSRPIEVLVAVSDKIQSQFIVTPNIYELLLQSSSTVESGSTEHPIPTPRRSELKEESPQEDEFMCSNVVDETSEREAYENKKESFRLREEQNKCTTLEGVRKSLSLGKGNFFMIDGLLFHKDKVLGEPINQLILPENRRSQVLKLAHESVFGSHMGLKKTKERIRYSFYWPNMASDISEFCKSCKECQLRAPEKVIDKIPITPVLRPELPFEVVNVDVIGPIEPPSARRHKYVLCLVDQHSRWPEAIPLRSLTAKNTCEALLEIFMRTGIPNVIASDQGTNFISKLTQEFMHRLGCSPRFSVPGYPASNGLVERYNKVLKNCLHHVIRSDPSNWDRYLPYLLFAYREVPNCTTGVSPFKLMYGREAKGPLSVLKSSWCGEVPIPLNMSKSVIDYLQDMKISLE